MVGLVHPDLPSAGKCDLHKPSPRLLVDCRARYLLLLHRRHKRSDVVADQVELVLPVRFSGVERNLRGWQTKDQPATANIDVREFQDVAEERAIGIRIGGIDDGVCADDHGVGTSFRPIGTRKGKRGTLDPMLAWAARLRPGIGLESTMAR